MLIGDKWLVESDEMNVTLSERFVSKKTGNVYFKPHSYYGTVENALKGMVNIRVNRTGLKDLESVRKEIKEIHDQITEALNKTATITRSSESRIEAG